VRTSSMPMPFTRWRNCSPYTAGAPLVHEKSVWDSSAEGERGVRGAHDTGRVFVDSRATASGSTSRTT
jgi:hypothetical protein